MADLTVSNDIDNFMQSADNAAARTALGVPAAADLSNVDNTSDADKPVSDDTQAALDTEAATRLAADNRRAFAGGVRLDGVSGYLALDDATFEPGVTLSFSAAFHTISNQSSRALFGREGTANWISMGNSGFSRFSFRDSSGNFASSADPTDTSQLAGAGWSAWAIVYEDDGDEINIYRDGNLFDTLDASGAGNATFSFLGRGYNTEYLEASFRDYAPFNRALSAGDVTAIATNGIGAYQASKRGSAYSTLRSEDDYSSASGVFGEPNATAIYNQTVDGESGVAEFERESGSTAWNIVPVNSLVVNGGDRVRIKGRMRQDTTDGYASLFYFWFRSSDATHRANTGQAFPAQDEWFDFDFIYTIPSTVSELNFFLSIGRASSGWFVGDGARLQVKSLSVQLLAARAYIPMTEGNGRQLRDLSGRYDALLSEAGYQHLQPKSEGYVRVKGADANPSIMMLEDSDIIPADSVITDIIAEERKVDVANTEQDLDDNRIRLEDSTGDLLIRRSDGSNHETLGTVTSPTDTDDVDVEVHYKQVIR